MNAMRACTTKLVRDSQKVTTLAAVSRSARRRWPRRWLLQELDREIRLKTRNKRSLDDVLRGAMRLGTVIPRRFVQLSRKRALGESSKVLGTELTQ